MIRINNHTIKQNKFPDDTYCLNFDVTVYGRGMDNNIYNIIWNYYSESEMSIIFYLTRHIKNRIKNAKISLTIPYIPNARMDRVKYRDSEVFTLKYFCEFINMLNFESVIVFDPHSHVSTGLINNLSIIDEKRVIKSAITESKPDIIFFPDEGSRKRYSDAIKDYAQNEPIFGFKDRDWRTGQIRGLDIIGKVPNKSFNVLIIDDICSKGGTFYHSAVALKKMGADNIDLYVSHCENSILKGEFTDKKIPLLETGLIKNVYTTNSIFTEKHDNIKIIHSFN